MLAACLVQEAKGLRHPCTCAANEMFPYEFFEMHLGEVVSALQILFLLLYLFCFVLIIVVNFFFIC